MKCNGNTLITNNRVRKRSETEKVCLQDTLYTRKRDEAAMNIRFEVAKQFEEVAREQGMELAPLTDDLALADSGLDSICFARIVVGLEIHLGLDPFSPPEDALFPMTYGEFVQCYEKVARSARTAAVAF
jgi:hypothetical protein